MSLIQDTDGAWQLSENCTLADIGEWIRLTAEAKPFQEVRHDDKAIRGVAALIQATESERTHGMEWTVARVACLLALSEAIAKRHNQTSDQAEAFVSVTMTMLAGYPTVLQEMIDVDLTTGSFRMNSKAQGLEIKPL